MVWDILIAGHGLTVKLILTLKKCFKTKTLRSHSVSYLFPKNCQKKTTFKSNVLDAKTNGNEGSNYHN